MDFGNHEKGKTTNAGDALGTTGCPGWNIAEIECQICSNVLVEISQYEACGHSHRTNIRLLLEDSMLYSKYCWIKIVLR